MNGIRMNIVIPVIPRDFARLEQTIVGLRLYVRYQRIVLVGLKKDLETFCFAHDSDILMVDESSLLDVECLRALVEQRTHDECVKKRLGWYFQQFVKMSYAFMCEGPYYLVWDADTIPIKPYEPFDAEGRPVFDIKTEYHKPYFNTISKLFADVYRVDLQKSFISEHMLIDASLMREMLNELGGRESFAKNILNAVDLCDLPHSGFSEFETFGNWALCRHPGKYYLRKWKSFRHIGEWFDPWKLTVDDRCWIRKSYAAISIERYVMPHELSCLARAWLNSSVVRHMFSFKVAVYVGICLGMIPLKYRHIE